MELSSKSFLSTFVSLFSRSHREWGLYLEDDSESNDCVVFNSLIVPDMNVLSCALTLDKAHVLCCGESKTESTNLFLGVPIYMFKLPGENAITSEKHV